MFRFSVDAETSPYSGRLITGYIDFKDSWPGESQSKVWFTPVLPHINVQNTGELCKGSGNDESWKQTVTFT